MGYVGNKNKIDKQWEWMYVSLGISKKGKSNNNWNEI